ncbi:hypothetical protein MHU86_22088 [Fragilaria crotonensis]|nr:hypothetical protein MHU86_22088 [Fragilaria crotonensis]
MDGEAAGMSTSNESSLNYSEVSDITLFSTTTPATSFRLASTASTVSTAAGEAAAAIVRQSQSQEQQSHKGDRGTIHESTAGDKSDQSINVRNANDDEVDKHTTKHAPFRIESESTPSLETDMADSGQTTGDTTDLTSTPSPENSSVRDTDPLPPVAPPIINPAEEGGFLAFLAQMRQVVEQPVDAALREFVPSDVAESARPAPPPEFTGDDAETVMARNEGNSSRNDRLLGSGRLSQIMDLSTRGGSMYWMFSIPPATSPSNDPLLSNRDKSKPPDFREIPLSYSPSAPIQPWGPNTSDLWTSTTRLLAAIPEEVASVMSTASMTLSFTKNRPPGSVDGDPKSGSKMKSVLAIAILITLSVAAAGLAFVVMAIVGSARSTLLTTAMPMPPITPPAPSPTILSSPTPSVTPSFRGEGVPPSPSDLPMPSFSVHPTTAGNQPSPLDGPMPATTGNHTVYPFPPIPKLSTAPTSEPPGSSYGVATEHPSRAPSRGDGTAPALGDEGFDSESPSSITDSPTNYPSFHVPNITSQAPVNENAPPWYSELIDELHPSIEPSAVSNAPTVEDLPPWYLDIVNNQLPSSEPSTAATLPLRTASPSLRPSHTSTPSSQDQQDIQDTEVPTVTSGQIPTASPSEEPTSLMIDSTTAMPTRGLDYGFQWTSNGEIQGNVGFRSVKMSEAGNRVAVATSSQVQVFERTSDDGPWQQFGSAIESPGIQAVSISGDGNTIAHGAFFDGNDSGSVRVDRWDGNAWTRIGSELPGSCPYPGCMELSREGSIIAIGNPLKNSYAGLVTVFVYDDDAQEWLPRGEPISGEIPGDMAGTSVSLSSDGTVLALGSPGRTVDDQISIGQAAIFKFIPAIGWSKVGQSLGGFEQLKQFGFSISYPEMELAWQSALRSWTTMAT